MPQNIIDTVFPVTQGEGFKPPEILPLSGLLSRKLPIPKKRPK